jgi:hypothetical protein
VTKVYPSHPPAWQVLLFPHLRPNLHSSSIIRSIVFLFLFTSQLIRTLPDMTWHSPLVSHDSTSIGSTKRKGLVHEHEQLPATAKGGLFYLKGSKDPGRLGGRAARSWPQTVRGQVTSSLWTITLSYSVSNGAQALLTENRAPTNSKFAPKIQHAKHFLHQDLCRSGTSPTFQPTLHEKQFCSLLLW